MDRKKNSHVFKGKSWALAPGTFSFRLCNIMTSNTAFTSVICFQTLVSLFLVSKSSLLKVHYSFTDVFVPAFSPLLFKKFFFSVSVIPYFTSLPLLPS